MEPIGRRTTLLGIASAAVAPPVLATPTRQHLEIVLGVDPRGYPTRPWIEAIRERVGPEEFAAVSARQKPLSADEQAWVATARQMAPAWFGGVALLNMPFPRVRPPRVVKVLLGNQGGDDAFGVVPDVTAFDLSSLVAAYGAGDSPLAQRLMPRLLAHEYTHLLAGPYLESVGWSEARVSGDPFLRALRTLFNEGLGNLRSIEGDDRWAGPDGQVSPRAIETLAALQPVMLERLRGLSSDPPPEEAKRLLRNISQGPFAGKWGAVPIALWLAADTGFAPAKIGAWVERRPENILQLAVNHADAAYRTGFQNLLAIARSKAAKL